MSQLSGPAPLDLGQQLLRLARGQADALADGDLESLDRLADERDALLQRLEQGGLAELRSSGQEVLQAIVELDRRTILLAQQMLQETGRQLREIHHGQAALRGYGRPGRQLARRPASLDQAG